MKSRYRMIKEKYGILGWCEKNNVEILNTIGNVIRCSSCPFFKELKSIKKEQLHCIF